MGSRQKDKMFGELGGKPVGKSDDFKMNFRWVDTFFFYVIFHLIDSMQGDGWQRGLYTYG